MVNIDTVYQRVLAIANKEQRGYITPQEFNLFANQAQMKIFEQYFYDINQFDRTNGNHHTYADPIRILEEKITRFKVRHAPVKVISSTGVCTVPPDIYRLGRVLTFNNEINTQYLEEVTQEQLIQFERSPLTKPTINRPIYERLSDSRIKIYPSNSTGIESALSLYFTQSCATTSGSSSVTAASGGNLAYIKANMNVQGAGIPSGTKISSISGTTITLSKNATATSADVSLTFSSGDIVVNYIARPSGANWAYTVVNEKALFDSSRSSDFDLHESEEVSLVYEILELSGIAINKADIVQAANSSNEMIQQKEKQ